MLHLNRAIGFDGVCIVVSITVSLLPFTRMTDERLRAHSHIFIHTLTGRFPWLPLLACDSDRGAHTASRATVFIKQWEDRRSLPHQTGRRGMQALCVSVCVCFDYISQNPTQPPERKIDSLKRRYVLCPRPTLSSCPSFLCALVLVPDKIAQCCRRNTNTHTHFSVKSL